jgi:microcystin-dependent protein
MKRHAFMLSGMGAAFVGSAAPLSANVTAPRNVQHFGTRPLGNTQNVLLGSLLLSPYDFVPAGFEPCEGQSIPIRANVRLFTLLGTTFGGDGVSNFALPDMRGRAPLKGLSYLIAMDGIYPNKKDLRPAFGRNDQLLGQLLIVAYLPQYVPPNGWEACEGQLLTIGEALPLFSLIGTKFGGDGIRTFALPDLRKREVAQGLTYLIAMKGDFPSAR